MRKRLDRLQRGVDKSAARVDKSVTRALRRSGATPYEPHDEIIALLQRAIREQEAQRRLLDRVVKRSNRLERNVAYLLRAGLRADPALGFPEALTAARFRLRSQNDEDGMTHRLIQLGGVTTPRFVELGSGLRGGNSAFLVEELGWSGLMVDADERRVARVAHRYSDRVQAMATWVTPDNIDDLLLAHGFDGDYGLLSIDIDGADIWVWENMSIGDPAIVIIEYNSAFGPERSVAVPIEQPEPPAPAFLGDDRAWKSHYFGASLTALTRVASRKGYRLVAAEPRGVNAFFLRDGFAPEVPEVAPSRAFHLAEHTNILMAATNEDIFGVVARLELALVEVS